MFILIFELVLVVVGMLVVFLGEFVFLLIFAFIIIIVVCSLQPVKRTNL